MNGEADVLRREVATRRQQLEGLTGEGDRSGAAEFAPDGSGDRPVVLPKVSDVPVGQDTGLLHMSVKPFLRRRLGDSTNAAQVLVEVVQRDAAGREWSWNHLPSPLVPQFVVGDPPHAAVVFGALGDAANRRLLGLLWGAERAAAELAQAVGMGGGAVRKRLGVLQELGWVDAAARRYRLTARGRRAVICVWAVSSAVQAPA